MEIFFQKKPSFRNLGPRKFLPSPQTRRQVSAPVANYGYIMLEKRYFDHSNQVQLVSECVNTRSSSPCDAHCTSLHTLTTLCPASQRSLMCNTLPCCPLKIVQFINKSEKH